MSQVPFDTASTICPELLCATYSTGTPSCSAIALPRSTGTPAYPVSVLVDQNAPPAGLIAIATRSLPVGAISSFSASAPAGVVVMMANPTRRPDIPDQNCLNIGCSSPARHPAADLSALIHPQDGQRFFFFAAPPFGAAAGVAGLVASAVSNFPTAMIWTRALAGDAGRLISCNCSSPKPRA